MTETPSNAKDSGDAAEFRTVTLASPRTIDGKDYKPDEEVQLPLDHARRLVRDGRARWTNAAELDDMDLRVAEMPPESAKTAGATRRPDVSRTAASRPSGRGGSE